MGLKNFCQKLEKVEALWMFDQEVKFSAFNKLTGERRVLKYKYYSMRLIKMFIKKGRILRKCENSKQYHTLNINYEINKNRLKNGEGERF